MTKTYRLTYESAEVMHALFDKAAASQGWRISARVLREYVEFFGPKTEQLDMIAQEGKAIFTSFTEKISDGKGTYLVKQQTVGLTDEANRGAEAATRNSDRHPHRRL